MDGAVTQDQIIAALEKLSWRLDLGVGPKVVYPDEVVLELFGKDVMDLNFIETSDHLRRTEYPGAKSVKVNVAPDGKVTVEQNCRRCGAKNYISLDVLG